MEEARTKVTIERNGQEKVEIFFVWMLPPGDALAGRGWTVAAEDKVSPMRQLTNSAVRAGKSSAPAATSAAAAAAAGAAVHCDGTCPMLQGAPPAPVQSS